uniref:Uncharacterized protein n=1 Tax=Arundo donax TaxID=35708 RepID=A0A0A8YK57_ARUDO
MCGGVAVWRLVIAGWALMPFMVKLRRWLASNMLEVSQCGVSSLLARY